MLKARADAKGRVELEYTLHSGVSEYVYYSPEAAGKLIGEIAQAMGTATEARIKELEDDIHNMEMENAESE